jgi:hypothetical protein
VFSAAQRNAPGRMKAARNDIPPTPVAVLRRP